MTTTTLMTFLLRTPPNVGSVKLLGSWDNFTKPYAMEKDGRIGSGHWRGCHTFKNIICDGDVTSRSAVREGGLKMGGTYWYYYELDGGVEYHNPVEPATTLCPLLPGQIVNILQVPMYFSGEGQRSRGDSVSSTSSDHRTMNPDDKFLKPRPAPKLPQLFIPSTCHTRAASGPTSPSNSYSKFDDTGRSRSQPSSATRRGFLIPRKRSPDGKGRSLSPSRPSGFRAALSHLAGSLSTGGEQEVTRRDGELDQDFKIGEPVLVSRTDAQRYCHPLPGLHSTTTSREPSPRDSTIMMQSDSASSSRRPSLERDDNFPYGYKQPFKIRSRDPSPLRKSISSENFATLKSGWPGLAQGSSGNHQPLETLREVASRQNSPMVASDGQGYLQQNNTSQWAVPYTEKRLPTLPNSPSSVFAEDAFAITTPSMEIDPQALRSHFSMSTVASPMSASPTSSHDLPRSHFSEWSHAGSQSLPRSHFSEWSQVPSQVPPRSHMPSPTASSFSFLDHQTSPSLSDATSSTERSGSSVLGSPFQDPYTPSLSGIQDVAVPLPLSLPAAQFSNFAETKPPKAMRGLGLGEIQVRPQVKTPNATSTGRQVQPNTTAIVPSTNAGYQHYELPTSSESASSKGTLKSPLETTTTTKIGSPISGGLDIEDDGTKLAEAQVETITQLMDELSYLSQLINNPDHGRDDVIA